MTVVLYKPEVAGNVGAIARLMGNFGFSDLVIIDPVCNPLSKEALDRAKHAQAILKKAKIANEEILKTFSTVVGTTCRLGTDYNVTRTPQLPSQLSPALRANANSKNIALLFGSEGSGLPNEVLVKCDYLICIPTTKEYPALNLSHAVSVVLYELSKVEGEQRIKEKYPLMKPETKAVLEGEINRLVNEAYERRSNLIPTIQQVWKRVLGSAHITGREGAALVGFFKGCIPKNRREK